MREQGREPTGIAGSFEMLQVELLPTEVATTER